MNPPLILALTLIGLVASGLYVRYRVARLRRERLLRKYRNQLLVDRLIYEEIFEGETAEQLRDSLGEPAEEVEEWHAGRSRTIWRYHSDSRHRYQRHVSFEHDVVVGWRQL